MNALVGVFHTLTLTNVADDTCIETLDLELQRTNPESIIRLQDKLLIRLKAPIDTTRLEAVDTDVLDQK